MKTLKRVFLMMIIVSLVLACFYGCSGYMSEREMAQYKVVDYNLIWDKGDAKLNTAYFLAEYYSISEVSEKDAIAHIREGRTYMEGWGIPEVLMHQDIADEYTLDATSARFTLREYWFESLAEEEYWINLEDNHRVQVLDSIDEEIAKDVIADLSAESRTYQPLGYDDTKKFVHTSKKKNNSLLTIEIYLNEYDNILWMGEIIRCNNEYYIAIHTEKGGHEYKYLPCNDKLSTLIVQIQDKYDLVSS